MILPWSINRSYQAVHWLITFCSSSGERFLSHFVPRNNSMYSDVVCVLIPLVFLSVILRRSGSRTRFPCSTHSVQQVQQIQFLVVLPQSCHNGLWFSVNCRRLFSHRPCG